MTYHQQSETPKDRWHTPKRRGGEATDRPCNVDWNGIHLTTSKWQLAILNSRAHILAHSLTGQAWTKACNHLWTATIMVWQVMTACTHLRCILQFVNVRITPSTNSLDCSLSFCFFSSLSLVYAMINLSTTFCIVSKTSCIPALIEHEHLICLHLQLQKPHTCTCTPITKQCMEAMNMHAAHNYVLLFITSAHNFSSPFGIVQFLLLNFNKKFDFSRYKSHWNS